jgi:Domain of unknown function (DUF3943)
MPPTRRWRRRAPFDSRLGAGVFCLVAGLSVPSLARAGSSTLATDAAASPVFSLGLDGWLQAAAPYELETAEPTPIAWTLVPVKVEGAVSASALAGIRLPNAFATPADAATSSPSSSRHFWTAAGEMALVEVLPWVWNRYVTDEEFARISWSTVSANFHAGFGFDSDHFNVNQAQHPYQGALFYEAGRSNGYTYWESGLFALAGSFIWECCMENTQPSWNDLVNTTLGGMARGEVQHRLAQLILDNTATGGERFWRELGAAIVNPVGALSRLVNGDMGRNFPNPDERYPDGFALSADLGYRHTEGRQAQNPDQGSISLAARYGDPFYADVLTPFDAFWASMDLNFPGGPAITSFEERGILRSWELTDRASSARQVFAISQEYEYRNNEAEVFGAESFSGGWLSRYALGSGFVATTDFDAVAIPLAGVKTTDFVSPETGRNYDYGPGGGLLATARLYFHDAQVLEAGYGVVWTHTVNGVSDNNTLEFLEARVDVPIVGVLGAGGSYEWYSRKTSYRNGFVEARQAQTQWGVFLRLAFGATGLRTPKD